jgi:hypothetical protein
LSPYKARFATLNNGSTDPYRRAPVLCDIFRARWRNDQDERLDRPEVAIIAIVAALSADVTGRVGISLRTTSQVLVSVNACPVTARRGSRASAYYGDTWLSAWMHRLYRLSLLRRI